MVLALLSHSCCPLLWHRAQSVTDLAQVADEKSLTLLALVVIAQLLLPFEGLSLLRCLRHWVQNLLLMESARHPE